MRGTEELQTLVRTYHNGGLHYRLVDLRGAAVTTIQKALTPGWALLVCYLINQSLFTATEYRSDPN